MNTSQPLHMESPESPGTMLLSPAAVLLLAADAAVAPEHPAAGKRNAQLILNALLGAAQANGFTQCDIFLTLAAQRVPSERLRDMAQAAMGHVSAAALKQCLQSITLDNPKGAQS